MVRTWLHRAAWYEGNPPRAAFGMQAIYRQDTRQATIVLTLTDTTPAIIAAILTDPRIDHGTAATQHPQTGPWRNPSHQGTWYVRRRTTFR